MVGVLTAAVGLDLNFHAALLAAESVSFLGSLSAVHRAGLGHFCNNLIGHGISSQFRQVIPNALAGKRQAGNPTTSAILLGTADHVVPARWRRRI